MPSFLFQSAGLLGFTTRILGLGLLLLAGPGRAQVTITSVTTSNNTSAASSTETGTNPTTLTFQNDVRAVTSFTAGGNNYAIQSTATNAYVRRNTGEGNLNNSYAWSQSAGTNTVAGTDVDNFATMLLGNNLNQGAINLFANGTDATQWQSNIERVDFVWSAGVSVLSTDGFAVFDLNGSQEEFQIALITSLGSGLGSPLSWTFTNGLEVTSTGFGSALDIDNNGGADSLTFNVLRYTNGDTINSHADAASQYTQSLDGTFIRMSDLGIADGTMIYGYAIMASDVSDTAARIVNWNTELRFPNDTSAATGGLDLAGFNGQLARRFVPEPATYGAMLMAAMAAFIGWRRRQLQPIPVRVRVNN